MENNMVDVLRSLANSTEVAVIDRVAGKTLQVGRVCDLMERDYSSYTVKQFMFTDSRVILSVEAALCEDKEYYFSVGTMAEGYCNGYVKLTPTQARAVAYATDKRNWVLRDDEGFSGDFSINLDDWKTIAEIEGTDR